MTQVIEPAFISVETPEQEEKKKEEEEKKKVKVRFCVFFDGTCNNRTNTEQRELASEKNKTDAKHKEATVIYDKYKGVASYENDYTNIAKMEKYIDKADEFDFTLQTYVEGPGTDDKQDDSKVGYGLGVGDTGIREKVEKCSNDVVSKITKKVKVDTIIECIVLDVFGFSRGAAGARNFIHEAIRGDELEPIKSQLVDEGYDIKKVKVCFAGLYDTVSSHGVFYFNDVSDLKLRAVRYAEKVVHLAAADEHRNNFSLTSIDSAGFKGREIFLPGVHSDIGGSYRDGETEKQIIYDGSEHVAKRDREDLINAGWYKDHEIKMETYMIDEYGTNAILTVNRPGISNKYSRIPLHVMAGFARDNKINVKKKMEGVENIPSSLRPAKNHIDKYIDETDPDKKPKRRSQAEDWQHDNEKWLRDLRHSYFHFSAKWEFGLKPRMSWWSSTRYRKTYRG